MNLPQIEQAVPYTAIEPDLATGDLFLLQTSSTQGQWIARLERQYKLPPYSHVGMVIKDEGRLLFWDAPGGGDCFPDPYTDDPDNSIHGSGPHPGCRVSELRDVLAYYATRVEDPRGFWVRHIGPPVSQEKFIALRTFINRVDGLPFPLELGYGALAMSFVAGQGGVTLHFGTYFCSQLIADSYMHMGLLEMNARPPNAYAPAHFAIDTADFAMTDPPPLVPPATLGELTFVEWDLPPGHGTPCEQEAW